jgi:hypothetical protein
VILVDPAKNPLGVDRRLATETDPLKRRMLEEVRFHIAIEATCRIEPAIERLAPHCEYVLFDHSTQPVTISGREDIRAHFYAALFDRMDARLEWDIVNCWCDGRAVITEGRQKSLIHGRVLRAEGFDVDPDGRYLQNARHLVVWPFDEQVRLIGETVYFGFSQPLEQVAQRKVEEHEIGIFEGEIVEPGNEPLRFEQPVAV